MLRPIINYEYHAIPNRTKLSENSHNPLNPRFWTGAVRFNVVNETNSLLFVENMTKFLNCPQYVPIFSAKLSSPS